MSDTITPEERILLKKVHRQGWDIDEGDMSIYRNIDGEITCKLASDFECPEEIARELVEVWNTAWPIAVRLESAVIKATTRAEQAEAENARLKTLVAAVTERSKAEKNLAKLRQLYLEVKEGWHFGSTDLSVVERRQRAARERLKSARQAEESARRAVAGEGEPS